jgi:GMP synthase - Glutamine amidotransferase domain
MKKLLIVKTGTTYAAIAKKHGDFEDFIINQIGISPRNVVKWSVYQHEAPPNLDDVSAVIITGSHSMVTEEFGWSVFLSEWLRNLAHKSVPILGICYGHQLIVHAFGGSVNYHPHGQEMGTVTINLTEEGRKDPLLKNLPSEFLGHVMHAQTVVKLPPEARVLAENEFERHHAFVLHDRIWGVQFHPEFTADITYEYIEEQRENLLRDGYDINLLLKSVQEHSFGKLLLNQFVELISGT